MVIIHAGQWWCPEYSFLGNRYHFLQASGAARLCLPLALTFGGEAGGSLESHRVLDTMKDSPHCVLCKEYHCKGSLHKTQSCLPTPLRQQKASPGNYHVWWDIGVAQLFVDLANLGNSWERVIKSKTSPKKTQRTFMPKAPAVHRRSLRSILTGHYKVVFLRKEIFLLRKMFTALVYNWCCHFKMPPSIKCQVIIDFHSIFPPTKEIIIIIKNVRCRIFISEFNWKRLNEATFLF